MKLIFTAFTIAVFNKMKYLFSDIEKSIVRKLKNTEPKQIWSEFLKVIIEFDDSYIELECIAEKASAQNKADEAIIVKISEFSKKYEPNKYSKKIVERTKITNINTVRTLLYFTDSIEEPETIKKLDSQWNKLFSKIARVRQSQIDKLFEGTTSSYHSEVVCKPNSEEAKSIRKEHSNLIDVGLILEFGNKHLPIFIVENNYGFGNLETKPLLTSEELKTLVDKYELNHI